MDSSKKILLTTIGIAVLIVTLVGVTYSFFNYTRTGSANVIKVGRIYFNTNQADTINLTNAFPIDKDDVETDNNNTDDVVINITGDTTYSDGIEYLLTIKDLTSTVGTKTLPVDIVISSSNIGDSDDEYFDNRGGTDPIYHVLNTGTVYNNQQLLVGYIPKGSTGINGSVTIRAYLDKNKIAISDTYPEKTKYVVNSNMTQEEMDYCTSYIYSKYRYSLNTTAFEFCEGTGTISSSTFQEMLDQDEINTSYKNDLLGHNIVIELYTNGTTSDWVNVRTILTTEEWNSLQTNGVSFKVKIEANEGIWFNESGESKLRKAITAKEAQSNTCSKIVYRENNITYLSGTETCVDMNYVWYSGKLWRITSIYPDGSMKLVTEDMITAIFWGSSAEYDGSWVYQWLNEDFYSTLVNPNNIIDSTSIWNYSEDGNSTPVRPETIATQKIKTAPVGLLNAYEYYNSYRCIESLSCTGDTHSTGYLNINYSWWLLTPLHDQYIRSVKSSNGSFYSDSAMSNANGVRPSIVLKPGIVFSGEGSKDNPYKVVGDKEEPVNNTTLLSSRSVGEYVKFDNDLYRIVDTTDGITKLTRVDNLRDPNENDRILWKTFASSVYYGKSDNTQSNDYWDYYLNNTWYNNISTTYKNMLIDGTYYLGLYPNNTNYKSTICKDDVLDSVTTKNCTKYTVDDEDKIFTGKVGLPRAGEMFSSQIGKITSSTNYIFTVTPVSNWSIRSISINGYLYSLSPGNSYSVRPSITLKPGIKIIGGTGYVGGETDSPFEISE